MKNLEGTSRLPLGGHSGVVSRPLARAGGRAAVERYVDFYECQCPSGEGELGPRLRLLQTDLPGSPLEEIDVTAGVSEKGMGMRLPEAREVSPVRPASSRPLLAFFSPARGVQLRKSPWWPVGGPG